MRMRFVPTKAHAAVDHVVAPALLAAPELFGLKSGKKDSLPVRMTGIAQAAYANLTDYELAARRLLPVKAHLALDGAAGAALGAMPWLLGTAKRGKRHWLPHAVVGAAEIGLALTTKTEPGDRHRPDARLKAVWKAAKRPATWKAVGKTVETTGKVLYRSSGARRAARAAAHLA